MFVLVWFSQIRWENNFFLFFQLLVCPWVGIHHCGSEVCRFAGICFPKSRARRGSGGSPWSGVQCSWHRLVGVLSSAFGLFVTRGQASGSWIADPWSSDFILYLISLGLSCFPKLGISTIISWIGFLPSNLVVGLLLAVVPLSLLISACALV